MEEPLGNLLFFYIAPGHETTAHDFGNAIDYYQVNPDQSISLKGRRDLGYIGYKPVSDLINGRGSYSFSPHGTLFLVMTLNQSEIFYFDVAVPQH